MARHIKYLGGLKIDEERDTYLDLLEGGDVGICFKRKFAMADIEGLSTKEIQKGELAPQVNRRRAGDKVFTTIVLSREAAFALRQLLNDFLE